MRSTALVLIVLTQLDGSPILIESDSITIIKPAHSGISEHCRHGHGSAITIGGRGLCLKETPDQICAKIEKFGGKCEERP
jgi:hypothetical protein